MLLNYLPIKFVKIGNFLNNRIDKLFYHIFIVPFFRIALDRILFLLLNNLKYLSILCISFILFHNSVNIFLI